MTTNVKLKIYEDDDKKEKHVLIGRLLGAVSTEEAKHLVGNLKIAAKVSTAESKSIEDVQKALLKGINTKENDDGTDRIVLAIKQISSPETNIMLDTFTRQLFVSDRVSMVKESHIKPGRNGSRMTLWCRKESLIICEEEE
jgi:hypothetical protein